MNIKHHEKGFHLSDRELLYVARKIGKLATYCKRVKDEGSSIRVDTEYRSTQKSKDAFKMSATVELPHKTLRAESRKGSVEEAVDRCIDKLVPQVKKYKDLHTGKGKTQAKKTRQKSKRG